MDSSNLKFYFWWIAFLLFAFISYQSWHDANFPTPVFILDMARKLVKISLGIMLGLIGGKILLLRSKEKADAKFKAEEDEREHRSRVMSEMELGDTNDTNKKGVGHERASIYATPEN